MSEMSITIPVSAFQALDEQSQIAIMNLITTEFGVSATSFVHEPNVDAGTGKGLTKLDVAEARIFLNKCSEKTTRILQEIVKADGKFLASDIAALFGASIGELRGAWSGLTKRVRTVTNNPDAVLLNWFRQGEHDWQGIMAAQTVASMRVALSERG
jgi:hypothetical protein